MLPATKTIGLLSGSFRSAGNGSGIAAWLASRFKHVQEEQSKPAHASIARHVLDTSSPPFPLGPVQDPIIPMNIQDSLGYPSDRVREWSQIISSLSGLVVLTPEYNWSYPGELKNALDHIYNEWKGLPVVIVTFGSRGGGKAGTQLKQVMEGALRVKLVSQGDLEIALPRKYIGGTARVGDAETQKDDFLAKYEGSADEILRRLLDEVVMAGRTSER